MGDVATEIGSLTDKSLLVVDERNVFSAQCPSRAALDMVADKWAVLVVHTLLLGTRRHSELMDSVGGVSQKMLTQTLRELERAGMDHRNT